MSYKYTKPSYRWHPNEVKNKNIDDIRQFTRTLSRFGIVHFTFDKHHYVTDRGAVILFHDLVGYWDLPGGLYLLV